MHRDKRSHHIYINPVQEHLYTLVFLYWDEKTRSSDDFVNLFKLDPLIYKTY